jgi:hypothetical protein
MHSKTPSIFTTTGDNMLDNYSSCKNWKTMCNRDFIKGRALYLIGLSIWRVSDEIIRTNFLFCSA